MNDTIILSLKSALSSQPIYVKMKNDMILDAAIMKIIQQLEADGKSLEAKSLKDMYASHQLFNNEAMISKGALISSLKTKEEIIENKTVKIAEIDLIASHSGGL